MKVLLVFAAFALLQHVSPGSARSLPPPTASNTQVKLLQEMYYFARQANATVPGRLRKAMVPVIDDCEKNTFCKIQMTLSELPANDKINVLCDSLMLYNNHTHMNCTDSIQNTTNVTFELQELFIILMDCINKEVIGL